MILLIRAAVALIVLALAIGLLIKFNLVIILYKMLLLAWAWLVSFKVLAKIYVLRQILSPFSRIVSKSLITIFGVKLFTLFKSKLTLVVDFIKEQFKRWSKLPFWFRWGIFLGSLIALGVFGFGIYILPIWIPFLQPVFRKLHMWWFDTVALRYLQPARLKLRYTLRNNPVLKILRRPHRVILYFVVIAIRRTGRFCRSAIMSKKSPL
jgi:hypothetical protein